jgi:hypothetical protein
MKQDIVIVREGGAYRLLHGHLRLANVLKANGEAWVEVPGGHRVRIVQAPNGYLVASGEQQLPLLRI